MVAAHSRTTPLIAVAAVFIQLSFISTAPAQLANLLKDIHPTNDSFRSDPRFLASIGEATVFTAHDPQLGRELWVTNGTPEGTRPSPVLCSGDCSSDWAVIGIAGDHLYLIQRLPEPSFFHWNLVLVDTTSEITSSGGGSGYPSSVGPLSGYRPAAALGARILFSAQYNLGGQVALFFHEDNPDLPGGVSALPFISPGFGLLTVGENVLLFGYGMNGVPELWRSDGTPAGTMRVSELPAGDIGASIELDDESMFFVLSRFGGDELWVSDGTASGTRALTSAGSMTSITQLVAGTEQVYFFAASPTYGQELWRTDGSPDGTVKVTDFAYAEPFGVIGYQSPLVVESDRAFFFATDGESEIALWRASGGPATAQRVIDVSGPFEGLDKWLVAAGERVFFLREDPGSGQEVWSTESDSLNPGIFWDACSGVCSGAGIPLANDSSRFAYAARSSTSSAAAPLIATAPWNFPTSLFDPFRDAPFVSEFTHEPPSGIFAGQRLYFAGLDHFGRPEPWVSLGTPANTILLADIGGSSDSGSDVMAAAATESTVAFVANGSEPGQRLWLSNGSPESTRPVEPPDAPCGYNPRLHPAGQSFVFFGCGEQITAINPASNEQSVLAETGASWVAASDSNGIVAIAVLNGSAAFELWRSDGTVAGTAKTLQFPPGLASSFDIWVVNGRFLLSAGSPSRLYSLSEGLTTLQAIGPAEFYPDGYPTPEGQALAFFSLDARVWRTDGTPAGTYPLTLPGDGHRVLGAAQAGAGHDLLLSAVNSGVEVWRYTGGGTATLRAVVPPTAFGAGTYPVVRIGNRIYFATAGTGSELWTLADDSDQVENLEPEYLPFYYIGSSYIARLGDDLLFQGCEPAHGCELWATDGSNLGTRLLHDLNPGPASSAPNPFAQSSEFVFLTADDGLHGPEPWAVSEAAESHCTPSAYSLCLATGRFQVTSSWRDFAGQTGDATAVPLTADTGYFWFFDDQNVEMILKVLDGTGLNGHHWVFYGALTNVEYHVTVADGETGATKRYFNSETRFASAGDIQAFGPLGAHGLRSVPTEPTRHSSPPSISGAAAGAGTFGSCAPSATRFCILEGRFAVEAHWEDFEGNTGVAFAGTLTDDTGYLYFFDSENVEVVLKAIDGGGLNDHFWIYYGALSNVEYTITVTDTVAGASRIYRNPLGSFGSFGDIEAFPAD